MGARRPRRARRRGRCFGHQDRPASCAWKMQTRCRCAATWRPPRLPASGGRRRPARAPPAQAPCAVCAGPATATRAAQAGRAAGRRRRRRGARLRDVEHAVPGLLRELLRHLVAAAGRGQALRRQAARRAQRLQRLPVLADRAQLLRDRLVLAPRRILALLGSPHHIASSTVTAPVSSARACNLACTKAHAVLCRCRCAGCPPPFIPRARRGRRAHRQQELSGREGMRGGTGGGRAARLGGAAVALLGSDALLVGVDARLEVRHALAVLGLLGGLAQPGRRVT